MISMTEIETKRRKAREDRRRRDEREEARRLYDAVDEIMAKYEDDNDIGPTFVATAACKLLDGFDVSRNGDFYTGTNLYLRQIARGRCRSRWETEDEEEKKETEHRQHRLFPDLQERYPIARMAGEEPVYRKLEHLTDEDYEHNLRRMDSEIGSKQKHRDALAAHYEEVKAQRGAA